MIRIVLVLIGVAFCILSSLTAPAHASPVMVSSGEVPSGFQPAGVVTGCQDSAVTIAMPQPGIGLPNSPGQCSADKR